MLVYVHCSHLWRLVNTFNCFFCSRNTSFNLDNKISS
nr:MAG TPA: Ima1 N-terminal domain [Caudoviricetes sp.]